jgi:hypothetical protein
MPLTVYEERYRFTPYARGAAPFLALIMTGAVTIILVALYQVAQQPDATTKDVLFAAAFGTLVLVMGGFIVGMALTWIVAAARHWTALRVDQHGVTLGRRPFPGSRPMTVPWSDIEAIVVFANRGLCIGLRLTPSAPRPSPGPPAHTWMGRLYIRFMTTPNVPVDVYLGVQGWDLDPEQLVAAMDAFAPRDVELVDAV